MLAELQKLDGLPVIRGDQEEEEANILIFLIVDFVIVVVVFLISSRCIFYLGFSLS